MAQTDLIICLGSDARYWEALCSRFQGRYVLSEYKFDQFDIDEDQPYPKIFMKILKITPKLIFIDFTSWSEQKIRLSQMLAQDNATKEIPLIGLVMSKDRIHNYLVSGTKIVHVKSGEFHDVVYSAAYLCKGGEASPDTFAKAVIKDKEIRIELIDDFRVSYITPDYVHIEGNLKLDEGQEIELDIKIPQTVLVSKKFIVKKVYLDNIYGDFKYAYDLSFVYVEKPNMIEASSEEYSRLNQQKNEAEKKGLMKHMDRKKKNIEINYLNILNSCKRKMNKWVLENMMYSKGEKKTRVLVVDKSLTILRESEQFLDAYPFSIRTQIYFNGHFDILFSYKPHLILYQYTSFDITQMREEDNMEESQIVELIFKEFSFVSKNIQQCMDAIRPNQDYQPIFVVFNSMDLSDEFSLEDFPQLKRFTSPTFDYPLHIVCQKKMHIESLLDLAKAYESHQKANYERMMKEKIKSLRAKNPVKYKGLRFRDFEEKRYYISATNPLAYAATSYLVRPLTLTESEIEIASSKDLEMTTYRLTWPVPMFIRLVSVQDKKDSREKNIRAYKALIHSIGELDKAELRRQVNESFCAPVVKERKKELHDFVELNEQKSKELKEDD